MCSTAVPRCGVVRTEDANSPPRTLAAYYQSLGLPEDSWYIGPEHPGLENLAVTELAVARL